MDDPSQSANQAAGRQDHAEQEKWRAKMMQGSMTGLVERNTKWDVEYEGKDAKGTLVRPFEPGFGDARKLPEKMMGETMAMAVARGMGRNLPHSGAGDGTHVFKTADDPERLRKLRLEERLRDAPPDVRSVSDKTFAEMTPQELQSWKDNERRRQHLDRLNRGFGKSPVMKNNKFDNATTYSRASPTKRSNVSPTSPVSPVPSVPRSRDKPLRAEGAHAMLDRMGPNILSGPIPRDGFTTDVYEERTRVRLHELGFSDVLGETGSRPEELENGIDHLDKLEHLSKSAKDLQYSAGFTGNEQLYKAKLDVS